MLNNKQKLDKLIDKMDKLYCKISNSGEPNGLGGMIAHLMSQDIYPDKLTKDMKLYKKYSKEYTSLLKKLK